MKYLSSIILAVCLILFDQQSLLFFCSLGVILTILKCLSRHDFLPYLLGIVIPFSPQLGTSFPASLLCLYILLSPEKISFFSLRINLLLLALIASCFSLLTVDPLLWDNIRLDSLAHFQESWQRLYHLPVASVQATHQVINFFLILSIWQSLSERHSRIVLYGVATSIAGIISIFIANKATGYSLLWWQDKEFFLAQARQSLGFSDPNAAGIFLVLCLPILYRFADNHKNIYKKIGLFLMFVPLVYVALQTGSRSFILGIVFYSLVLSFKFRYYLPILLVFAGGVCSLVFYYTINSGLLEVNGLPTTLQRLAQPIKDGALISAFESRIIFWKLSVEMFLLNPFFGVGLDHFRLHLLPIALQNDYNLGVWNDNANNFYLGILAELGIVGALYLIYCLYPTKLKPANNWTVVASRESVLLLAFLFLFGPHLHFLEVSLLFGLLLAISCHPPRKPIKPAVLVVPTFVIFLMVSKNINRDRGWYLWEKSADRYYRWSSSSSTITLPCQLQNSQNVASLSIQSLRPAYLGATEIEFNTEGSLSRKSLASGEYFNQEFSCSDSNIKVDMQISPAWSPSDRDPQADWRSLGVVQLNK